MSASRYVRMLLVASALVGSATFVALRVRATLSETSTDGLAGVVVADTALRSRLDPGSGTITRLAAGTRVRVLAHTATPRTRANSNRLHPDHLVRTVSDKLGWVHGSDLALDVRPPLTRFALGWTTPLELDLDGDLRVDRLWLAVREGWDVEAPERHTVDGFLVADIGAQIYVMPFGESSGWGTAETIVDTRGHDLDGDQVPEVLLLTEQRTMEAGYTGLAVVVVGFDGGLVERLRIDVGDPWPHPPVAQERFGWLELDDNVLVHHLVHLEPECTHGGMCLRGEVVRHRLGAQTQVEAKPMKAILGGQQVELLATREEWSELAAGTPDGLEWHPASALELPEPLNTIINRRPAVWSTWVMFD